MENVTKITARWSAMALAALVVLLPAEQVLAQAEQREAISVQQEIGRASCRERV